MTSLTQTIVIALLGLMAIGLLWDLMFREVSLRHLGMSKVIDTLHWQPNEVQQAIYARGSMTRLQWRCLRRSALRRCHKELV